MSYIPRVDDLCPCLQGTASQQNVIGCAPCNAGFSGMLQHGVVFLVVQGDNREPFSDIFQEEQNLLAAQAVPTG